MRGDSKMKKKPTDTRIPEFRAKYHPDEKELKNLEFRVPVKDEITDRKEWHKEYVEFFETHSPKGQIYEQKRTTFNHHLKTKKVEIISDENEGPDYERTTYVPKLKILNFWKNIYLAYCSTIPPWEPLKDGGFKLKEVPKTPLSLASPKNKSEALQDLINQFPELLSNPDQFKELYFTDKKGKNRRNVIKKLQAYLGGGKDRIQAYSMFKRVIEFTRRLVEQVAFLGDIQKYQLASIFLLGYLGVKFTPIQIKDHLRK